MDYGITKLSDVSLSARTLEMQKVDPIANLTFPMRQILLEKRVRIQRQFSLLKKITVVEVWKGVLFRRLSKNRCWICLQPRRLLL